MLDCGRSAGVAWSSRSPTSKGTRAPRARRADCGQSRRPAMSDPGAAASGYDIFLSYGTPDREWVRGLNAELQKLGLKVFQDERDLKPGDNWVLDLSGAMLHSRSMALVLSV